MLEFGLGGDMPCSVSSGGEVAQSLHPVEQPQSLTGGLEELLAAGKTLGGGSSDEEHESSESSDDSNSQVDTGQVSAWSLRLPRATTLLQRTNRSPVTEMLLRARAPGRRCEFTGYGRRTRSCVTWSSSKAASSIGAQSAN